MRLRPALAATHALVLRFLHRPHVEHAAGALVLVLW